ncbi:hCG1818484 [Homo sapiens]|nr:hCG1818484 [Homo sapiens]
MRKPALLIPTNIIHHEERQKETFVVSSSKTKQKDSN